MTFEEWYETAPLIMNAKDAFRAAWEAGRSEGYDEGYRDGSFNNSYQQKDILPG